MYPFLGKNVKASYLCMHAHTHTHARDLLMLEPKLASSILKSQRVGHQKKSHQIQKNHTGTHLKLMEWDQVTCCKLIMA